MPKALLLNEVSFTGTTQTPAVMVPANRAEGQVTAIISAPISPLNVFDISLVFEVEETLPDGSKVWQIRDSNLFQRDLLTGPLEAVNYIVTAQVSRWAGKRVRATFSCGQSILAVSLAVSY